jgi:opacity protein-like surface antigen
MKKAVLTLCSLATLTLSAGEDDWTLNNSYALTTDIAFFRRSLAHNHNYVYDTGLGTPNSCGVCEFEGCNNRHLVKKFKYEPGFHAAFSYTTEKHAWEGSYLWISDWESCCFENDPGLLYFSQRNPDFIVDFAGADTARVCYTSQFQNGEVNYIRYVTPHRGNRFSVLWLAGLRYVYIDEELDIGFDNGPNHSSYHIHAWNNIPTLQVGGGLTWNPTKTFSWDLVAKVGMGFDWVSQHTRLGDLNNTFVVRNYEVGGFVTPVVADAVLTLTYQPWRLMNVHASYQVIYLNGVALAPDQIVKHQTTDQTMNANGVALFHGWTAGLTFSF